MAIEAGGHSPLATMMTPPTRLLRVAAILYTSCSFSAVVTAFSPATARHTNRRKNNPLGIRKPGIIRAFETQRVDSNSRYLISVGMSSPSAAVKDVDPSKTTSKDIIDSILDECLRYQARRPIMFQFDPASRLIWKHWRGTVLAETWTSAARMAVWATTVFFLFQKYPKCIGFFNGFHQIWGELLAVTTFTLTFFVNEAYSCWRKCLDLCYNLQGGLNDLSMTLAGSAKRDEPSSSADLRSVETTSRYTPQSRKILMIIARYIRLFNILSYASFTRSHRPLLTPQGMRQCISRGLMTEKEHSILINSRISATLRHNEVLMWVFRMAIDARKAGHFEGGTGFEQNVLLRIQQIRGCGNYMESILRGRMPFGYAHFCQVLVNLICVLYPIMAFSSGISVQMGVVGTIFLTMTYRGLIDLSKRFLDPFHNDIVDGADPIRVDTLIAEVNAGSRRWMFGLDDMPISLQAIQDGGSDLDLFILPDEGISVEEAALIEAEKETEVGLTQQPSTDEEELQDEQQTLQEEFEQTQAILSAPPGADFVPGLDDLDEDCTIGPDGVEECKSIEENYYDDTIEQPPNGVFDQYLEILEEEYEDALQRDSRSRGETEPFS